MIHRVHTQSMRQSKMTFSSSQSATMLPRWTSSCILGSSSGTSSPHNGTNSSIRAQAAINSSSVCILSMDRSSGILVASDLIKAKLVFTVILQKIYLWSHQRQLAELNKIAFVACLRKYFVPSDSAIPYLRRIRSTKPDDFSSSCSMRAERNSFTISFSRRLILYITSMYGAIGVVDTLCASSVITSDNLCYA